MVFLSPEDVNKKSALLRRFINAPGTLQREAIYKNPLRRWEERAAELFGEARGFVVHLGQFLPGLAQSYVSNVPIW